VVFNTPLATAAKACKPQAGKRHIIRFGHGFIIAINPYQALPKKNPPELDSGAKNV